MHNPLNIDFVAVAILGGEIEPDWEEWLKTTSLPIYAADRGAEILFQLGIAPQLVIGDLDSLSSKAKEYFTHLNIVEAHPTDKDQSDGELLFSRLSQLFLNGKVMVIGAGGGRWDHFLFNVSLLERYPQFVFFSDKEMLLSLPLGQSNWKADSSCSPVFSLLSISEESIISVKDAKYELEQKSLKRASTLGLSNIATSSTVAITLHQGVCLLVAKSLIEIK